MNSNSIVLIEIGGSHDECLLTQMHAIKAKGHEIVLICTENIRTRNPIFKEYVSEFITVELSHGKRLASKEIKRIWEELKSSGVKKVIINTAQGNHVRKLCLYALFNKIEFIGIIHTTLKFKGSFTQRLISLKIKKYLLLSKHLLSTIEPPKGVEIDYFYPIRFPSYNKKLVKKRPIITIIGGVESRRSDLCWFKRMLPLIKDHDISFVFLGQIITNDPEALSLKEHVERHDLIEKVVIFDSFTPQESFDAYLCNTDIILPLIHPGTQSSDQYFKNQISGAMSISFGYKIPMMLHEAYKHITEMNAASFYYNEDSFLDELKTALQHREEKRKTMLSNPDYNVDLQEHRYAKFIFHDMHAVHDNIIDDENENDIAVIMINYNSSDYTLSCIDSVLYNTKDSIKFQIIVIDNASEDDSYFKLESEINKIDKRYNIYLFRSIINLGFSGGNMLGVQFSSAKYYFFLNNDCVLQNDCLNILFKFCEENSDVSQCSPQLYNENGEHQPCFDYFPYLITKKYLALLSLSLHMESDL